MDAPRTARNRSPAAWLAGLILLAAGCQFPAIDQSGQRIFSGGSTGLAHHDGGLFHHRRDREPPVLVGPIVTPPPPHPVVAVPPPPSAVIPIQPIACGPQGIVQHTPLAPKLQVAGPACPDGIGGQQAGPVLTVTPSRIVAPIHSEVLLAAGVCDGRGYYVLRQPLEWMLAQDGVGQIMAVGKESPLGASYVLRHSPQKVATNYVRAHTSTIEQTIDRGTPSPADDVLLRQGQSFITVSSPTEGTSHVTVWAPKEQNWERRQATATIFWVDARWQFPPPAAGRAGQKQVLQTVVTRSGGDPVAGWIVRYEVAEGPEAAFSARGDTAIEVRTDAAGRATVELLPRTVQPGITTVRIQVIRPAARGDLPQMVVGQGQTAVSWSTSGLAVTAVGPSTVAADGAVSYRVEVTNNGDLATPGVALSYTPPAGVTVLSSTPAAQQFGQRYQWQIGDLPPRTTSVVEVNCRAAVAADIRSCFKAESGDRMTAEGCATTRVMANALSVRMTGPEAVEVGREARFLVDITNIGTTTLTGLVASDTFDPGLAHTGGEPSPLRRAIEQPLAPGETAKISISLVVRQPGRHSHRLDVTADGGHVAGARAVVTGTQPAAPVVTPPRLSVRVSGPRTERAGQVGQYFVEVTNSGTAAATNVLIDVQYGVNLELVEASEGHVDDPRRLMTQWRIAQLAGGETVRRQVNCRCLNPDQAGALVQATVTSDRTAPQTGETRTIITPGAAPPPVGPAGRPPPVAPPAGNLAVTIRESADPIMQGGKTTYVIEIKNERAVSDRDVTLTLELSAGLKVVAARGPTDIVSVSADGRTVTLNPVAELRAGETLAAYSIEASGEMAGKQQARAVVKSALGPAGVTAQTETTVNQP
jgi:uncharacterized repeat protein (TIGR01451 family)